MPDNNWPIVLWDGTQPSHPSPLLESERATMADVSPALKQTMRDIHAKEKEEERKERRKAWENAGDSKIVKSVDAMAEITSNPDAYRLQQAGKMLGTGLDIIFLPEIGLAGTLGAHVGGYGGAKLGEVVDRKLGTKFFTPALGFIGGGLGIGGGTRLIGKFASKGSKWTPVLATGMDASKVASLRLNYRNKILADALSKKIELPKIYSDVNNPKFAYRLTDSQEMSDMVLHGKTRRAVDAGKERHWIKDDHGGTGFKIGRLFYNQEKDPFAYKSRIENATGYGRKPIIVEMPIQEGTIVRSGASNLYGEPIDITNLNLGDSFIIGRGTPEINTNNFRFYQRIGSRKKSAYKGEKHPSQKVDIWEEILVPKNLPTNHEIVYVGPTSNSTGRTFRLGLDNPNAAFRTTRKGFKIPTNVSENEALGFSKHERNNITLDGNQDVDMTKVLIKGKDGQFKPAHIDYEHPVWSDRLEYGDIYSINGKVYKRGRPGQFTKNNLTDSDQIRVLQRDGYSPWERNYVLKHNRNGIEPTNMIEYARTLPEPDIKTTPFKGNDWFNYFDMFYENLGYDTSKMSPIDKLKIIEDSYNKLRAESTGKLKGRIFWNGNPDRYTWSESGPVLIRKGIPDELTTTPKGIKATRTSSSDNHGYFFGFQPFVQYSYPSMGRVSADKMIELVPKARADMQPYMVNDINTIYERLPEGLHGKIPKNTVVNPSTSKGNSPIHYINGTSSEIGVGHGTPIKSIFPHPKAFIKGEDGIVTLTRNWKNSDVHFKQGGKLKWIPKNNIEI